MDVYSLFWADEWIRVERKEEHTHTDHNYNDANGPTLAIWLKVIRAEMSRTY